MKYAHRLYNMGVCLFAYDVFKKKVEESEKKM